MSDDGVSRARIAELLATEDSAVVGAAVTFSAPRSGGVDVVETPVQSPGLYGRRYAIF